MKIVDSKGKLIYDMPAKPRNFDGWAHGTEYGLMVDGERLKIGSAETEEQARYRLDELCRAYLDGTETFTPAEV